MINLSFREIARYIEGSERESTQALDIFPRDIYFDSRKIKLGSDAIFIALKTPTQDGHDYIEDAHKKGVRNFIVSQPQKFAALETSNVWVVDNPIETLQELAKLSRKKFKGLMVGITGSNGKTIVKEWMYQLLAGEMKVWRSPRSYNSQLGVALSLLKLDVHATVAFVEAGISQTGDMEKLTSMVKPQMAVFTHFGDAHSDQFETEEIKLREKCLLFKDVDLAVINGSIPASSIAAYREKNPLLKVISWSWGEKASYVVQGQKETKNGLELSILHKTQTFTFEIPFKDKASIANSMTCLCCLAALEQLGQASLAKFRTLNSIENRLVSTRGKRNNLIINDSYSNDLSAFEIALNYAHSQVGQRNRTLIFSDFGVKPELISANIGKLKEILEKQHFDLMVAIGPWLYENKSKLSKNIQFFKNKEDFLDSSILSSIEDSVVLIKGARKFALEEVSKLLETKVHQTQLKIDLTAIKNNVRYHQSLVQDKTMLLGMVKALGYGAGDHEMAAALQSAGVEYLGIAFASEAADIRKNGITLPIMVLNSRVEEIRAYRHLNLEPVIYSFDQLDLFKRHFSLEELNIHIELDSGMHRLGFDVNDAVQISKEIPAHFKIKSIFSHLADSENPEADDFTAMQSRQLQSFATELITHLEYKPLIHLVNSAAIKRHPEAHFDMVRLGIGMYGIASNDESLQTAVRLVSQVTQIKEVPAGDGIGYGRRSSSEQARTIAILPIGYADGLMRALNNKNKGRVHINGQIAPIVGNICMDMCMVDITNLDIEVGDEAELFGNHISIQEVAEICQTIPYEILSRISTRVKRVYSEE
ncbi:bifunctional UDP-N-acetylmuramoyl-tripeptide:D-alanyl-D-alanine ligase/alanine racemase [Bacteroidia bacterium]|nr:bifunctional UDP-N-acetylmuramoyl-tripeptide:D-alanyl-D-alanine ligase/alanine racemase [Bacteroidia bacterium]